MSSDYLFRLIYYYLDFLTFMRSSGLNTQYRKLIKEGANEWKCKFIHDFGEQAWRLELELAPNLSNRNHYMREASRRDIYTPDSHMYRSEMWCDVKRWELRLRGRLDKFVPRAVMHALKVNLPYILTYASDIFHEDASGSIYYAASAVSNEYLEYLMSILYASRDNRVDRFISTYYCYHTIPDMKIYDVLYENEDLPNPIKFPDNALNEVGEIQAACSAAAHGQLSLLSKEFEPLLKMKRFKKVLVRGLIFAAKFDEVRSILNENGSIVIDSSYIPEYLTYEVAKGLLTLNLDSTTVSIVIAKRVYQGDEDFFFEHESPATILGPILYSAIAGCRSKVAKYLISQGVSGTRANLPRHIPLSVLRLIGPCKPPGLVNDLPEFVRLNNTSGEF